MRYRNLEPLAVRKGRGNLRTSAIGQDTRSKLLRSRESAALFEADMSRATTPVVTDGEETFPHESAREDREAAGPRAKLQDLAPVNIPAQDGRPGGRDAYRGGGGAPRVRLYSSDSDTVSRELDVSSPTAANVAQVLNALLSDMARESVVVRT